MEINKVTQGGVPSFPQESTAKKSEQNVKVQMREQEENRVVLDNQQSLKAEELSKEDIQKAVDGFNQLLSPSNSYLKFQLHENLNQYYVAIVDSKTDQVIKEVPPKKILDLAADIWKKIGLIVDRKI